MISKSIATSEQVASVSLLADYLFTRMIPHLDQDGRMSGSPRTVRGIVCPLREDVTSEQVAGALGELDGVALIHWYEVDGQRFIEFPKFKDHQRGARFDRESPSRIPPPSSGNRVAHSGPTPDHDRSTPVVLPLSEVKGSEVKGSEVRSTPDPVRIVRTKVPLPEWATTGAKVWEGLVGSCEAKRFHKALAPIVELFGADPVMADVRKWVEVRRTTGKACRLEWYAEEASARLHTADQPLWDAQRECLTAYGERMTRPAVA
jgi:hypothetical protein